MRISRLDRFDGLLLIGMLLMSIGIGLFDPRVGIVAIGATCIIFAIVGARAESRAHPSTPAENVAASRKEKSRLEIRD